MRGLSRSRSGSWYLEERLCDTAKENLESYNKSWGPLEQITDPFWAEGMTSLSLVCFIFSSSLFYIICISLMYLPLFTAQHKVRHAWSLFLFSVLRKSLSHWKPLSLPTASNNRYYLSIQIVILYHLSSNTAAATAIVIYLIKQLMCAWISNSKITEIFHLMSYKKREHTHHGMPSFRKGSICRTKYRHKTVDWAKWASGKRYILFDKSTCYWTSFCLHVFSYPTCTLPSKK